MSPPKRSWDCTPLQAEIKKQVDQVEKEKEDRRKMSDAAGFVAEFVGLCSVDPHILSGVGRGLKVV